VGKISAGWLISVWGGMSLVAVTGLRTNHKSGSSFPRDGMVVNEVLFTGA